MMKLLFATGNPGKVITPRKELAKHGIELIPVTDLSMTEIQADTCVTVAVSKAEQAFRQALDRPEYAGLPLLANDAAFHIEALNGFPGPFASQVTRDIKPEGYLRLMEGISDRRCRFHDAWVVIADFPGGPSGQQVFERLVPGRLARHVSVNRDPNQKSELWKVFVPDGHRQTLADMRPDQLAEHRSQYGSVYPRIAAWLLGRER